MFKRLLIVFLGLMIAFLVQSATAADPKWQEKQTALFEQIGLKPGDIIDKADWEKVDGLLPTSIMNWLKRGDIGMKIAELKYDVSHDDEWINAGPKNAGKFKLDEKKNILEAAAGKPPLWVFGIPFPNVDIKNDPDGAAKFMYNQLVSVRRVGSCKQMFTVDWIGPSGFERNIVGSWTRYYYWARPDGPRPNPSKHRYMDKLYVYEPYDVAGISQLTWRKLDGTADDMYAYIPTIRRVKRMSGANRSDPYMGTDYCIDDGDGWSGLTNSMKWRFVKESKGLQCNIEWAAEHTNKMRRLPNGTWRTPADEIAVIWGWEVEGTKVALWAPVNVVWVPRNFVVVEAIPLDPYYNYGKLVYWIDRDTYWITYKIIWDRAMEYWKTIMFFPRCFEWADKKGVQCGASGYVCFDEKTKHATQGVTGGRRHGRDIYVEFANPKINRRYFTVERLRTASK